MPTVSVARAESAVRRRIQNRRDIVAALRNPSLRSVRAFLELLAACVDDLNQAAGFAFDRASLVKYSVVQSAYPALLSCRQGRARDAIDFVIRTWKAHARGLAKAKAGGPVARLDGEREFRAVFSVALSELVQSQETELQARQTLRRLMIHLGLSQDDLGRMFDVAGETIRRWERGENRIPDSKMAALQSADTALVKLLSLFRPERLPQLIRHKAEGFEGERALDWILRGRIAEVADRYDLGLLYQA